MRNRDVAEMLDRAARILALRGENRYRVRAYQKAARIVAALSEDIERVVQQDRLQNMNGIGAALAEKIKEIVKTGNLAMLERIETSQLSNIDTSRSILLASALTFSRELLPQLTQLPGIASIQVTGETRRLKEMVSLLEIVIAASDVATAKDAINSHEQLHHLQWNGYACDAIHSYGIRLRLYLTSERESSAVLWRTTGSSEHIERVEALIQKKTALTLEDAIKQRQHLLVTEAGIYELAGLPLIEPELREDRGEIAAAQAGMLPRLIQASDYKGDLHVHTDWSDGTASVEKMVEAAVELGYEFLAVTDHSRSLKIANGLSLERLSKQRSYIAALQDKYKIRILAGIEADILDDGSLDAPDVVLADLDVVIASVHSGFRQSREKLTNRICRAMQNPYVQILGHATGRLLGKREPYDVDTDEIIRVAARTGTVLEINSSPDRLDITDTVAKLAKEAGVAIAINTDAHSQLELANMILGLSVARRGWLESANVINTANANDVLKNLQKKRDQR